MGIHDREYYREEPSGIFLGGPRMMVTNLVILNVAIYLVDRVLLEGKLSESLGLTANLLHEPWKVWQLVTYAFVHSNASIWHLVFNMIGLWFFGREVEYLHGPRELLSIYLTGAIFAGLVWLGMENGVRHDFHGGMVGASGAIFAIMIVFVIHYPMKSIYVYLIPMPAWLLAVIYVGQSVLGLQEPGPGLGGGLTAHAAHLGGAAYGAIYYKTRWSLIRLLPRGFSLKSISLRPRPKLRVHDPRPEDDRDLDLRVDAILEKISREGEASLTRDERRFLEDASRRFQKRRR